MKTTKYTIGTHEFKFETAAQAKIDSYRKSIKEHFSGHETEDAIEDIDLAIIEKIYSKIKGRADKTVMLDDIEKLIRELGTVEQITDQEEIETEEMMVVGKKLYRDMNRKWIGGVCAGLATYIGLPIWVVRLAFLIGLLSPIPSFLPYLFLWYILPPTKTKADDLRMRGIPVSLSSLSNTEEYVHRRVIGLAKVVGIFLGILTLFFTAIVGVGLISFFSSRTVPLEETTIYEYACEKEDSDVTISIPNKNPDSILASYRGITQEYNLLYSDDIENVYQENSLTLPGNRSPWQFAIEIGTTNLSVRNRNTDDEKDNCEIISIRPGVNNSQPLYKKLQDFGAIDDCLDSGSVWDYRKRRCLTETKAEILNEEPVGQNEEILKHVRESQTELISGQDIDIEEFYRVRNEGRSFILAQYPKLESRKAQEVIDHFLIAVSEKFKTESEIQERDYQKYVQDMGETASSFVFNTLVTFDIPAFTKNLKVVHFIVSENTGGTGSEENVTFIFNEKGEWLNPQSIVINSEVALPIVAKLARQKLISQAEAELANDSNNSYYESAVEMIQSGTEPTEENFQNIGFNDQGDLLVFFDKYQVAAGSKGIITVTIPHEDISSLLTSNFLSLLTK